MAVGLIMNRHRGPFRVLCCTRRRGLFAKKEVESDLRCGSVPSDLDLVIN